MSTRGNRLATGAFATTSAMGAAAISGDNVGIAGFTLVASLRAIFKSIGMYSAAHPQVIEHSQRLVDNLQPLFNDLDCSEIQVATVGRHFYVNGDPVRPSPNAAQEMAWFAELTDRLGLVEIRLVEGVNSRNVAEFANHLRETDRANKRLVDTQFENIELFTTGQDAEMDELIGHLQYLPRFPLLAFYAEALGLVGQWVDQLRHGAQPDAVSARRIIARAIDALHSDPSGVLGLINLKPLPGSPVNRRLDSALVCLAIGKQLAVKDDQLLELGTTALIRPVAFPKEAWWERESLDGKSAAEVAYRAESPLEIITSFEGSAPPGRVVPAGFYGHEVQPHVATLIIAVASAFVDLLQPGESSNPFSPETALQLMLTQAGEFWEPTIVCSMAYALGLYPPGTIVRLNSGDVAVVVRRPLPGSPIGRPCIRPIELASNTVFDLARAEMATYKIVGSTQRTACEVNPLFVFLQ
jgi:hypothetical protein